MLRSFSYSLLITCFLLVASCKTNYVPTSSETENISVSGDKIQLDSQLVKLYLPYKNALDKDMQRVISVTDQEMVKGKPESNLTNFLGDLLLEEANLEAIKSELDIEIVVSYFNYGGIRNSLPKGNVDVGAIFEIMPFENEMVFLKLSGNQMQEFLDQIAAKGGDSVGGVRFVISNEKAVKVEINGKPLNENDNYWLVTNDYVADGGDDFEVLTQRAEIIKSGIKIRDLLILHLEKKHKSGEVLTAKLDGRISNE